MGALFLLYLEKLKFQEVPPDQANQYNDHRTMTTAWVTGCFKPQVSIWPSCQ
jgi:hypothetical protein